MILSIIIVNYNVKHFLNQCLKSIQQAKNTLEIEVYVVDNNSVDNSVDMVKKEFPDVNLIENKKNVGFAKANNQAIKLSKGKYILLLNPDTIIQENTLTETIAFFNKNTQAGGVGVKMIDGKGHFLPESKRSFPTPSIAFYKIFGLSRLFPKSKIFGKYHLKYLDKDEVHEIDVISGAFLMTKKNLISKIGMLDEDFFMYGEDIDLSYRIQKSGFKNYYLPHTSIIHYKGESTKKTSVNYIYHFYNAMVIFTKKHYSQKNAKLFFTLINLAIVIRAALSIIKQFTLKVLYPLIDSILIAIGIYILKNFWENIYFSDDNYYSLHFLYMIPAYVILWVFGISLQNGYKYPIKIINIIKGVLTGTIIMLIIYALLPDYLRFSRALIILGTIWTMISTVIVRYLLHQIGWVFFQIKSKKRKKIGVIASEIEFNRIRDILVNNNPNLEFIGQINEIASKNLYLGKISQLKEVFKIHKINEVIFSAKDISANEIISIMQTIPNQIEIKIAPSESTFIVGSNSIHTQGDLYVLNKKVSKKITIKTIIQKIVEFFN